MAVITQKLSDKYAIWNGDSCEVLPTIPSLVLEPRSDPAARGHTVRVLLTAHPCPR